MRPIDICLSGVWPFLNTVGLLVLAFLHRRTSKQVSQQSEGA